MGHVTIKTKVIALAVLVVGVIGSYNVSVKGLLQKDTQTQTVDTVLEYQREILRRDIARYPVEVMLENAKHQIVQKEEAAKLAVQQEEERQKILNSTTYVWSEVSTPTYGQSYASITCDEIGLSSRLYWGDDQSMINTAQGVYEYTPSNTLFGELVKNEGVELTVETDRLVGNVAGILVSKKTGDMLRTNYGEASVNTVLNATIDGKMMMGYSNPYTSATGLNFLLSALASGGNDNIVDTAAVENFQKFQANVPLVSFTTQQMVQSADKGVVDGLVMEYQSYQNDPTLQRNYEFIPFGVRHDNPLYSIGNISAEKKEVIAAFVSLCAQNQAEATKDGFNGLDDYAYTGKVYDGNTIAQAQSVWKEEKDSGIPIVAEFVVDTSGSMRGEPINALKTAMINTIQYINDDNYIGIIGFDSDVREYLPIDQFSLTQKTLYKGAVNSLDANGNTAMYNGLCVAMDRIYKKSQELGGNCTPIIFVLTDGDSNTGYKFSETKDIIAGMNIPIYTISYNYAADSLSELASINEAASIVGNSEDITYKLRNLFNAEM